MDGRRAPVRLLARLRRGADWWGPALALAVLLAGALDLPGRIASADISPAKAKARKAPAARTAVGFTSKADGWAGTWTVNGKRAFGIDLDSRAPSTATGYTAASARFLAPQVGWTKTHRKGGAAAVRGKRLNAVALAQLAYLTDRYASSASPIVAVAAEHAVLLLTSGDRAQRRRESARWSGVVKAHPTARKALAAISADVADHVGPYTVTPTWTTPPTVFAPGSLVVHVASATGKPMTGIRITGTYTTAAGSTAISASTDTKGAVKVPVTVFAKGPLVVRLAANDLPGTVPVLYTPKRFRDRGSPDRLAERLLGAAVRAPLRATVSTIVAPAVPVVTTTTKPAIPVPGSRITDDVTLAGTAPGWTGRIAASLWGPFPRPPGGSDCDRSAGHLAARVAVDAAGDGTVTTPAATVTEPGYYTWTEDVPGNPLQDEVVTPCGAGTETFVIAGTPSLAIGLVGDPAPGNEVDVTLTADGAFPGLPAAATLTLYGPFATKPTATSCTTAALTDVETATITGDDTVTATTITTGATGYYTWTVALPAVGTLQTPASIPCASSAGTFVVSRPDIGPLDVTTTGSVGASEPIGPAPSGGPVLTIGSASVAAPLQAVPLNPPGIAVPSDYSVAGQLDVGAHVGDTWGTIVVAGRVGNVYGKHGALYDLSHVATGDSISLTDVNGLTGRFTVTSVTTMPRTQVLPATLFAQTGPLRLVILSATDPVFFGAGLITYRSHVVVTATAS